MASSDSRFAVDSSFALALIEAASPSHAAAREAKGDRVLALSGHAAFETFSVMTRLPTEFRYEPTVAAQILEYNFPEWCPLSARTANRLVSRFAELGIAGGPVFDALVAAAALENDRVLLSCDVRAESTYRKMGVTYEIVG